MASIEFITKKVEGKKKEIEKLEKKLGRILKAKETGWEVNPYYYDEHDLKYTQRDLDDARQALAKYEADLTTAKEKAASRDVKVIVEFLENWKKRMRQYYSAMYPKYLEAREEFYRQDKDTCRYWMLKGDERKAMREKNERIRKEFHAQWSWMEHYVDGNRFDTERFEKDIKNEADRKYDNIIERTNAIAGRITDAAGLEIGEAGELDGYVIGERGKAHVHTIGAGGWNIQCYHFRVLVHEVR